MPLFLLFFFQGDLGECHALGVRFELLSLKTFFSSRMDREWMAMNRGGWLWTWVGGNRWDGWPWVGVDGHGWGWITMDRGGWLRMVVNGYGHGWNVMDGG